MRKHDTIRMVTDILVVLLVPYAFVAWCVLAPFVEEAFDQNPGMRSFIGDERFEQVCAEQTREHLLEAGLAGAVLLIPVVLFGGVWLLLRRKLQRGGDALPSVAPADQV